MLASISEHLYFLMISSLKDKGRRYKRNCTEKQKIFFFFFVFLPFLGLLPRHMGVPRLGVESDL